MSNSVSSTLRDLSFCICKLERPFLLLSVNCVYAYMCANLLQQPNEMDTKAFDI